jgi:hypothetical protein
MDYEIEFKGIKMTLEVAEGTLAAEALAGFPVDEELVKIIRKEAAIYTGLSGSEIANIPVVYEIDPGLKLSGGETFSH